MTPKGMKTSWISWGFDYFWMVLYMNYKTHVMIIGFILILHQFVS